MRLGGLSTGPVAKDRLTALERHIAELLGSSVELLPEPVEKRRLQDQINRDRLRAF
jgi:hypothetical protein